MENSGGQPLQAPLPLFTPSQITEGKKLVEPVIVHDKDEEKAFPQIVVIQAYLMKKSTLLSSVTSISQKYQILQRMP
jgi:hypothetical protein